jgi:hypothetical protein
MGGGKYDLINRGPEGRTFKIELLPKIICKEKSGLLAKITSNEAQTTASSSFPEQKLLAIEAPPPSPLPEVPELSKHLENNPSILSLPSILESSQNNTQIPEEDPDVVDDDHHDYGVIDSEDREDEENYDPQDFVQNFYSQKPYLGF